MRARSRIGALPAAIALTLSITFAFGLALGGCGGGQEASGSRELDEQRVYGRVVARSEVSPRRVTLGDPVVWTLTATLPAEASPLGVRLDDAPSSLELSPRDVTTRLTGNSVVWRRQYDLRGFDLGALPLPRATLALRLQGRKGVASDSILFPVDTLAVDSLTPAATGTTARDRGPVDPGPRPIDWAVAGAILLLLVTAAALLARAWRRRRVAAEPVVSIPAEPPAIRYARELDALRREGAELARDAFHEKLSGAVRRYVSGVTGIDAIDLTTRELERELKRLPGAGSEAAAEVIRILRRSDLVKFARRADAWEEARALLEDAAKLSDTLRPLAPASSAGSTDGPASLPTARKGS
jgi:hypothetical protein